MSNAVLASLRAQIERIEGRPARGAQRVASGVPVWDAAVGGLPCPGLVSLRGAPGAGTTRLVAAMVGEATRRGDPVAWVDAQQRLHPPALAQLGVCLPRLVLVRPPLDQLGWTVEQLLASGSLPLVVVAHAAEEPGLGRRWLHAARRGSSTLVLHGSARWRDLPADVQAELHQGDLLLNRVRAGVCADVRAGHPTTLCPPPPPPGCDPWR